MPKKAKSILHSYEIEQVKTKRTCAHFGTEMVKGEPCLVIKEGYRKSNPYSTKAVLKMIEQARDDLNKLEETFSSK